MSLVQHRKAYDGPFGPGLLIVQYPDKKSAEMIMAELKTYEDAKVIDIIYVFTGDPDSKYKSFFDVLKEESKAIWKLWEDDRTRMYCAGDIGDVASQLNKVLVALTIKEGGLRDEEAMAYTARHTFYLHNY